MFYIKHVGDENWLSFSSKAEAMKYIETFGGNWEYSEELLESNLELNNNVFGLCNNNQVQN